MMTYDEFMIRIQNLYGDYPGNLRLAGEVLTYLEKYIAEENLYRLLWAVKFTHPVAFGPPDISHLEKARKEEGIVRKIKTDAYVPEQAEKGEAPKEWLKEILAKVRQNRESCRPWQQQKTLPPRRTGGEVEGR